MPWQIVIDKLKLAQGAGHGGLEVAIYGGPGAAIGAPSVAMAAAVSFWATILRIQLVSCEFKLGINYEGHNLCKLRS